jgi:hypothetical protein
MIDIKDLEIAAICECKARNFSYGVWTGSAFLGIRYKFGAVYLNKDLHWDSDPQFGTVEPFLKVGNVPPDIEFKEYELIVKDGTEYYETYQPLFQFLQNFIAKK